MKLDSKMVIDLVQFKQDLDSAVANAGSQFGAKQAVHAVVLKMVLEHIRDGWDTPKEAFDEVMYIVGKVFPDTK